MEKRELYDKFEELSQNLMSMLAEVEAIKANFSGILDENTALKLENDRLREHSRSSGSRGRQELRCLMAR